MAEKVQMRSVMTPYTLFTEKVSLIPLRGEGDAQRLLDWICRLESHIRFSPQTPPEGRDTFNKRDVHSYINQGTGDARVLINLKIPRDAKTWDDLNTLFMETYLSKVFSDPLHFIHKLTGLRRLPNETFTTFGHRVDSLARYLSSCMRATWLDVNDISMYMNSLRSLFVLSTTFSSIPSDIRLKLDVSSYNHEASVETPTKKLHAVTEGVQVHSGNMQPLSNPAAGVCQCPSL